MVYRVIRYYGSTDRVAKDYGRFTGRDTAEWIAMRAIEKHMCDVVAVIPERSAAK